MADNALLAMISQGGNPTSPPPDLATIYGTAIKLKELKQQQETQNALRMIYANPANIGPDGFPTSNAMQLVAKASPGAYMDLVDKKAAADEKAAQTGAARSEEAIRRAQLGKDALGDALTQYDSDVASGVPADMALDKAKKNLHDFIFSQPINEAEKDRQWSFIGGLDGKGLRAASMTMEQKLAEQKEAREAEQARATAGREERSETEKERHDRAIEKIALLRPEERMPQLFQDKDGNPIQFWGPSAQHPKGQWTDSSGNPIAAPGKLTHVASGRAYGVQQQLLQDWKSQYAAQHPNDPNPPLEAEQAYAMGMYGGLSAARTAGNRSAQIGIRANEVDVMADQAMAAYNAVNAKAIKPGQWLAFNKALQAGQTQLNDPELGRLYIAVQSLVNARAAAISGTGQVHIADQVQGRHLISGAENFPNFKGKIEQFKLEGQGMRDAANAYQSSITGGEGPPIGGKPSGGGAPPLPQAAMAQLKENHVTTFKNGQKWTLRDGKPVRVN